MKKAAKKRGKQKAREDEKVLDSEIKEDPKPPLVIVFGGGVTGLAAAHELIERGFRVHVLEPTESPDHYGCCEVGGMARTQYARLPKTQAAQTVGQPMQQLHAAYGTPQPLYFTEGSYAWDDGYALPKKYIANKWIEPTNGEKISQVVQILEWVQADNASKGFEGKIELHLVGHCADNTDAAAARRLAQQRSESAGKALKKAIDAKKLSVRLVAESRGADDPVGDNNDEAGRARNDRVSLELADLRLPGEHGYRFYPAFYRNLDEQLRRIPVYDREGHPTFRSVLENLEHAESARFGVEDGKPPIHFERRLPKSFEELRRAAEELANRLKFPVADILFFELKMLKFMTSSTVRRKAEYENVSWWEFVEGERYAPVTQRHLRAAPQALVAMEVTATDAYTAGNIYLQLLLDHLSTGARVDRTMNAPTSEAWLGHWKRYLRLQGVKFFVGSLVGIETDPSKVSTEKRTWNEDHVPKPRLVPKAVRVLNREALDTPPVPPCPEPVYMDEVSKYPGQDMDLEWEVPDDCHFVLALPVQTAKWLLEKIPDGDLDETLLKLKHYDIGPKIDPDPDTGKRDGVLRDFVGIQFYFPHDIKFTSGHTYYPDSDWGLSSISQLQFWKDRRTRDSRYLGVLSVDIGNMAEPDRSRYRTRALRARLWLRRAEACAEKVDRVSLVREQRASLKLALTGGRAICQAGADIVSLLPFQIDRKLFAALEAARDAARAFAEHPEEKLRAKALKATLQDAENLSRGRNERPIGRILAKIRAHVDAVHATALIPHRRHTLHVAKGVARAFHHTIRGLRITRKGKRAWVSSPGEIAASVWRQIKLGIDPVQAKALADPLWFHIDDDLVFKLDNGKLRVSENRAPFQINPVGDFDLRPGKGLEMPPEIIDDSGTAAPGPATFYEICNDQWLVAGMYTKTYTRLSTMELAVEAARHAVNGLLHGLVEQNKGSLPGKIMGDLCKIENVARHEVDDLEFLKRIDEQLYAEGLPHFVDILGLEESVLAFKHMQERGLLGDNPIDHAMRLLRTSLRSGRSELSQLANLLPIPNLTEPVRSGLIDAVDQVANLLRSVLGQIAQPIGESHRRDD